MADYRILEGDRGHFNVVLEADRHWPVLSSFDSAEEAERAMTTPAGQAALRLELADHAIAVLEKSGAAVSADLISARDEALREFRAY